MKYIKYKSDLISTTMMRDAIKQKSLKPKKNNKLTIKQIQKLYKKKNRKF